MREQGQNAGDLERGGVYSARDFIRSKFHSTTANDPAPAPLPLPEPKPDPLAPGPRRVGRFELIELLGRGGMGAVYRARDVDAGRDVALKITTKQDDPARVERFRREGVITASLDHPGIVRVHNAGHEHGVPWIAYELVVGQTLTEAFDAADREARVQMVIEAAQALGYAHSRGVVHRDVKPSNILVEESGRVRVADFGLALGQSVDRLTATGAFLGTPLFMSPEQFSGKGHTLTPASDVWSLGVILYVALTGEVPFDGGNIFELGAAIKLNSPKPPRLHDKTIPAELEAVCLKALQQSADDRYPDGSSLAGDLDLALSGRSEAGAQVRRKRTMGVAIGVGICGLALALAFARGAAAPAPPTTPTARGGSSEPQRPLSLAAVDAALAKGDLRSVHAELVAADLKHAAPEQLNSLRTRVLHEGRLQLASGGGLRDLEPVFAIGSRLNPLITEPPEPAFADAVMARALELEKATPEVLANPRVLQLVNELADAGLPPKTRSSFALLEAVSFPGGRPKGRTFQPALRELLLRLLAFEIDLQPFHFNGLTDPPSKVREDDPLARFLQLLIERNLAQQQERASDVRTRIQDGFRELLRDATVERVGRINRARLLCRLVRFASPSVPQAIRWADLREAVALAPDDPRVCRLASRTYLSEGKAIALRAGRKREARRHFALALEHAQNGLVESNAQGYGEFQSSRRMLVSLLEDLVALYVFVGRAKDAEETLQTLPTWTTPAAKRKLLNVFENSVEIHARLITSPR